MLRPGLKRLNQKSVNEGKKKFTELEPRKKEPKMVKMKEREIGKRRTRCHSGTAAISYMGSIRDAGP